MTVPEATDETTLMDHVLGAIRAGHVGQVTIFCDDCGVEDTADYVGETREIRFAAARSHLAVREGWRIGDAYDLCARCAMELDT